MYEIILIEENSTLIFEIQRIRTTRTVGPFIRKSSITNEFDSSFSESQKELIKKLKYHSPFLTFPIVLTIEDAYYKIIYDQARDIGVKLYKSVNKKSSIKRTQYRVLDRALENKPSPAIQIDELIFYIGFYQTSIKINPFFRSDRNTNLVPLSEIPEELICKKYPQISQYIKTHRSFSIWSLSYVDFELFYYASKEYVSKKTLTFLSPKNIKSIKSHFTASSTGIDWLNRDDAELEKIITSKIISSYIANKQYDCFKDLNQINKETIPKINKVCSVESESILSDITKKHSIINDLVRSKNITVKIREKLESFGFNYDLKDHQYAGISWILDKYNDNKNGVLLADEMGLGKTIQSLSLVTFLIRTDFKCIIICPSTLKNNWLNEIHKFIPALSGITKIIESTKDCFINGINIISCEQSKIHEERLSQFDLLIFDEAQKVKNKKTNLWKSTNNIRASFKLLLTGSPIENSERDLLNILEIITTQSENAVWNTIFTNDSYRKETDANKVSIIRSFFDQYILSRNKEDCLKLPNCSTNYINIDMESELREIYDLIRNQFLLLLSKNKGAHNFIALDALLKLRQLCSLPQLLKNSFPNMSLPTSSKKMQITINLIEESIAKKSKVVIFSVFVGVLDELEHLLNEKNILTSRIDGSLNPKARKLEIDNFLNNECCKVFLSTLHTGGVGINLVNADTVILYNSWWNPAVENQAISRVHRMGQENNVTVHIPIYKNSVEEKVRDLINQKLSLRTSFSDFSLNTDDYLELLR